MQLLATRSSAAAYAVTPGRERYLRTKAGTQPVSMSQLEVGFPRHSAVRPCLVYMSMFGLTELYLMAHWPGRETAYYP